MATDYDEGLLVGLLVGEGHFGGDGRQPQVTLRMHERHEALFRWIDRTFPGGRVYGPYEHGGRRYYQWMARGAYLRGTLLPILERRLDARVDRYAYERFASMRARYQRLLAPSGREAGPDPPTSPEPRAGRAPTSRVTGPPGALSADQVFSLLRRLEHDGPDGE